MRAINLVVGAFFTSSILIAQVGIGNTSPNSLLDIQASDQTDPSNQDGLLIPRVDAFPSTDPTVDQNSMLVFLTTTDSGSTPGFYYWDFPTLSWIGLNSNAASSNISVVNIEDFLFDAYSGARGPNTNVSNDNQYAFTPSKQGTASNSTIEQAVTGNDYMGIHQLATGSSSTGAAAVASSDWSDKMRMGGSEFLYETRVRFSVASGSAGTSVGVFGLSNLVWNTATAVNSHSTATAGVYFSFSSAGLVGTCKNGGSTSSTSALTVVANVWYKLKAIVNEAGTSVDFYVDGNKLGSSITTNIPGASNGMKLLGSVERLNGAQFGADIDYFTWRMTR